MPVTIRMRKSDNFPLQYQIADFDETVNSLIKRDLQNATVDMSMFTSSGIPVAVDIPCEILDETEGWVQVNMNPLTMTATPGMYKIQFKLQQDESVKNYPGYDYQWINIMGE